MSSVLQMYGRASGVLVGAGNTRYMATGSGSMFQNATETDIYRTERAGGTYSNLYVRLSANAASNNSTVRFRKNAADGNQNFTISPASTGEFEDPTNTDSVVAGDETAVRVVSGATGGITLTVLSNLFTATTNTYTNSVSSNTVLSSPVASTTYYSPPMGGGAALGTTTETNAQLKYKTAGTLKNMFVSIASNGRSTTTNIRSRLNAGNGTLLIAITGGTTGLLEDTSNSDAVVSGDLVNLSITTGTGTGDISMLGAVGFETVNGTQHVASQSQNTQFTTGLTRFLPLSGLISAQATEANTQADMNYACKASLLECYLNANTISATSTLRLRVGAADVTNVVSITASTTGWFEDTTHSDILTAASEVDYSLVTGASGTGLTIETIAMLLTQPKAHQPFRRTTRFFSRAA